MNSLNTCSVQAFQYHEETSHKVNRGQKATDLNCCIHTHGLHRQQQLLVTSLKICTELVAPVRISPSLKILSFMFDFTVFFSHFHHLHIEKCYFLLIWSPGNLILSSEYSRHDFWPQQLKTEKWMWMYKQYKDYQNIWSFSDCQTEHLHLKTSTSLRFYK